MTPYLSGGTKDVEAASLVIEPLARYDENGELVPYLADGDPDRRKRRRLGGPDHDHLEAQGRACSGRTARRSPPMTRSSPGSIAPTPRAAAPGRQI